MYRENDIVVYRREVCVIKGTEERPESGTCYILEPVDEALHTRMIVPAANKGGHLRSLMTNEELEDLVEKMRTMSGTAMRPTNMRTQYSNMLKGDSVEELAQIVKTAYMRNEERQKSNKRMTAVDQEFLNKAENYFFSEIAAIRKISQEEAKAWFIDCMNK